MIIRSKKGTNEKFAIQNEIQNLKNFYRKIEDSPSRVIARKLRDLRDVDTVSLKDGGSTVYAHMDMNGEELYFETRQDYVMAYVKIPVSGKVCRTEEDVDEVVSDVMDFLSKV